MQFNKILTSSFFTLGLTITLFLTACKKESNIVMGKNGFTMDISGDTINEFEPVHFTSTSSDDCIYLWDFGNGTASTERNPSISFPYHGTYTISLEITNSKGISSLHSRRIVILCRYYKQIHNGELL